MVVENTFEAQPRRGRGNGPALVAGAILALGLTFSIAGLPNVPLMWPMYRMGVVLPSCGLTRGVVAIFRGNPTLAWRFNPGSFAVVGGAAAIVLGRSIPLATDLRLRGAGPALRWAGTGILVATVLALWIRQQANAEFVMYGHL